MCVCAGMGIAAYTFGNHSILCRGWGGGIYTWVNLVVSGGGEGAQEKYLLLVAGLLASGTNTAAWMLLYPEYIASRNQKRKAMQLITLCRLVLNRTLRISPMFNITAYKRLATQ